MRKMFRKKPRHAYEERWVVVGRPLLSPSPLEQRWPNPEAYYGFYRYGYVHYMSPSSYLADGMQADRYGGPMGNREFDPR